MKKLLVFLSLISFANMAHAGVNPSSLMIKILEVRFSPNTDCSNTIRIFQTANPTPVDFVNDPSLGTGVIPHGTYHCVAIHLSDIVTITPAADDGVSCHAGVPFTMDIFNTPSQGDVSIAPDGTVIDGHGNPVSPQIEDDPWVYFSDSPSASTANNCWQPTKSSVSGPCPLTALPITGDATRSFVWNFDGDVVDRGNGHCQVDPPTMSIR
jgi:hypothetical protein